MSITILYLLVELWGCVSGCDLEVHVRLDGVPIVRYTYELPLFICTLVLMAMFAVLCCWTAINHIRTNPTEDDSNNDYNEDQEEETLSQEIINASTTSSSIVRESTMVPIIPEACLVEIDEEEENRVAGVAEPMSLLWEQVRAKIIRSSSFLICTLFVLVFLGAAFLIVDSYGYLL